MVRRRDARTSSQDHLAGHKFAVVFTQGTGQGRISWIARIGTGSPFPTVAEQLRDAWPAICRRRM